MLTIKFPNGMRFKRLITVAVVMISMALCLAVQASVTSTNSILVFNPDVKQGNSLFLIHNVAPIKILIGHPVAHPSASAGWDSTMDPNRWSAFMLSRPNFKITCQSLAQFNRYQYVNCNAILKVYYFPKVDINNPGLRNSTFWVAENQTLPKLLRQIRGRKIKIPKTMRRLFRTE